MKLLTSYKKQFPIVGFLLSFKFHILFLCFIIITLYSCKELISTSKGEYGKEPSNKSKLTTESISNLDKRVIEKSQASSSIDYSVNENNISQTIERLETVAVNNDYKAASILGDLFFLEKYGINDINTAVYWHKLAAENDQVLSQYRMAQFYREGKGIEKDVNQAFYYCQLAATKNYAPAQNLLGFYYRFGIGTSIEKEKSLMSYKLSAEQGNSEALFILGNAYEKDTSFVKSDITKAIDYYSKSAGQDYIKAQTALGLLYLKGKGLKQDYQQGAYWIEKAAKKGAADAQFWLGLLYLDGQGFKKDINQAKFWLNSARLQGEKRAQVVWDQNHFQ